MFRDCMKIIAVVFRCFKPEIVSGIVIFTYPQIAQ